MSANKPANEIHARCAARILRFTSLSKAEPDKCKNITDLAAGLLYGSYVDYQMLLAAQDELINLGGTPDLLDDIRNDFLH